MVSRVKIHCIKLRVYTRKSLPLDRVSSAKYGFSPLTQTCLQKNLLSLRVIVSSKSVKMNLWLVFM